MNEWRPQVGVLAVMDRSAEKAALGIVTHIATHDDIPTLKGHGLVTIQVIGEGREPLTDTSYHQLILSGAKLREPTAEEAVAGAVCADKWLETRLAANPAGGQEDQASAVRQWLEITHGEDSERKK